jgi:hypothetical protein
VWLINNIINIAQMDFFAKKAGKIPVSLSFFRKKNAAHLIKPG